jgi:hypothetical protein
MRPIPTNPIPADNHLFPDLPLISAVEFDFRRTTNLGLRPRSSSAEVTKISDCLVTPYSPNSVAQRTNFLEHPQNLPPDYQRDSVQNIGGQLEHEKLLVLGKDIKCKRERKDQKGVMRLGPNRFGRKGTIRCERCRFWRRKVDPQLPALL